MYFFTFSGSFWFIITTIVPVLRRTHRSAPQTEKRGARQDARSVIINRFLGKSGIIWLIFQAACQGLITFHFVVAFAAKIANFCVKNTHQVFNLIRIFALNLSFLLQNQSIKRNVISPFKLPENRLLCLIESVIMAIQWFPGHMNKAKKAIAERLKSVDMVIEMLDARLPASSENPLLAQLSKGKPKLKILNKQDLADPERTAIWLAHYNALEQTNAIALDSSEKSAAPKITAACRALVPNRKGIDKPLRVLICGIPNVGKSTLINGMIGKKSAKTGNEPGITKAEQRLFLADDFWLYDTPGMLWPKIIVEESGYNLAASGAVGRNALDEEEVALELLDYLRRHYLPLLQARYAADKDPSSHWDDVAWLEWIAKKRGALLGGGRVNYQKAAENILTDFREGSIGRITLETPKQWEAWLKEARKREAALKAEREAKKLARSGQQSQE